ncbi:MAG: BrnT family toxin [Planctomycetota bacterium]|jgi:uncharacterized DUF497 family protein
MAKITFSWDDRKATGNLKKHSVSFEEASTVFFDDNAKEYFDPAHSADEDRFLMLGFSYRLRLLVVSYCFRRKGNKIRIISARKATAKERKDFKRGGL